MGIGCTAASISSGELEVIGSFEALENSLFRDRTTTLGELEFELASACLDVSGTRIECAELHAPFRAFGFSDTTCEASMLSPGGCSCVADIQQEGGLGHVSYDVSTDAPYDTGGNALKVTANETFEYDYCAAPSHVTLTPTKSRLVDVHGTVVAQRID